MRTSSRLIWSCLREHCFTTTANYRWQIDVTVRHGRNRWVHINNHWTLSGGCHANRVSILWLSCDFSSLTTLEVKDPVYSYFFEGAYHFFFRHTLVCFRLSFILKRSLNLDPRVLLCSCAWSTLSTDIRAAYAPHDQESVSLEPGYLYLYWEMGWIAGNRAKKLKWASAWNTSK